MLTLFVVERTFYNVSVRACVEPQKRRCDVTITRDRVIVRLSDETDPTFRSYTAAEFGSPDHWSRVVGQLAERMHSYPAAAA